MFIFILMILTVIFLEKGVFSIIIPNGYIPQLFLLIMVIYGNWLAFQKEQKGSQVGLIILLSGLFYDLVSGSVLGLSSLLLLIIITFIYSIKHILPRISIFAMIIEVVIGTLFYCLGIFIYLNSTGYDFHVSLLVFLGRQVLVNIIGGVIVFPLFQALLLRMGKKKELEVYT